MTYLKLEHSQVVHYSLLISSALLYAVPYLLPNYFWWTIFFFLVPLFYLVLCDKLTLHDGLIWSTVAFSLHLSGVLEGLFLIAQSSFIIRLLPALFVLLTAIGYGTLWFIITLFFCDRTASRLFRLCIVTVTTYLFFLFLEHYCLFMFGSCEGYLLCNPLVPLVQLPALLYFLPKIGSDALLFVFVATQAAVAWACYKNNDWSARAFVLLCLSFWFGSMMIWYHQPASMFTGDAIACGNAYFTSHDNITYSGRVIRDYCKTALKRYPEADVILFPETAIRCPILPGEPQIVALFNADELGKPVTILTGGFRWDNDIYRNTFYWIHDGKVVDFFDKRHAMALTERAPNQYLLGSVSIITKNYFKTMKGITPNNHKRPVWKITKNFEIIPYICSELFFNSVPDHDVTSGDMIVALCNDDWIKRDFMQYQMVVGARYRAIRWQIPILYVAHFYQAFCGPHGEYQTLNVFDHTKQ